VRRMAFYQFEIVDADDGGRPWVRMCSQGSDNRIIFSARLAPDVSSALVRFNLQTGEALLEQIS
jgi:hypothetical protein